MTPDRYQRLRETLGDRVRAARLLGCSPTTIRLRESGHHPVSADAEARILAAVHGVALAHDAKRDEHRRRIVERREARQGMTAEQFQSCLDALGWSRREAARLLLAEPREAWRIGAWALGRTIIPWWIARDCREHLGLAPDAPFPMPTSLPSHRRRRHNPTCLPRDFRHALHLLGLSQRQAAETLGVANRAMISDWACGRRPVPRYIASHIRALLRIGPADPWPQREINVVLPDWRTGGGASGRG